MSMMMMMITVMMMMIKTMSVMMILVRYTIITLNVYLENFHHRYYITFKTLIVDTV